jgi:hypothetical protein
MTQIGVPSTSTVHSQGPTITEPEVIAVRSHFVPTVTNDANESRDPAGRLAEDERIAH